MENDTVKKERSKEEELRNEVNKYAKCLGACTLDDCMKCHETEQGCHEYWAIWCRDTGI